MGTRICTGGSKKRAERGQRREDRKERQMVVACGEKAVPAKTQAAIKLWYVRVLLKNRNRGTVDWKTLIELAVSHKAAHRQISERLVVEEFSTTTSSLSRVWCDAYKVEQKA